MEGPLRRAKLKLVQAWIEIHQAELMADWLKQFWAERSSRITQTAKGR